MTGIALTVVIAPDSFKGCRTARDVAEDLAVGWRSVRPHDELVLLPQADGGEGTLDAVEASVPGAIRRSAGLVTGPDSRPTPGEWLMLPDGTAVMELAQMAGLPRMGELDPLGATSRGLGQVIDTALEAGATRLVIGLGGSASTDAGTGALAALGMLFTDQQHNPVPDGGGSLHLIRSAHRGDLRPPPVRGVVLLVDVDVPLSAAATMFAPQKGATKTQVATLGYALAHIARLLGGDPQRPGSGAAGGTAYGLATVWGAIAESGAAHIAQLSGLDAALTRADIVLTGEGRFDEQSDRGKVAGRVLTNARRLGKIAGVVAGEVTHEPDCWTASLTQLAGSREASLADPARWLRDAGALAARALTPS
ncbi:MAG: glycerate kinase [Salinibacterium sp.]|nr:glycerate kinase [Salinibacterium sp.]